MKKTVAILVVLASFITANAQSYYSPFQDRDFDREIINIAGVLIGIFLFTSFFLGIIRLILDGRVKRKMLDKEVSENVVEKYLQPTNTDSKSTAIKWFFVLVCIGLGLTIINLTLPVGIHSIAIMSFSIALSFLGYFYYVKRSEK
ncbi:MAG TPA: hypothetical protein VK787_02590 [Puia sp.]|jgi:hypothetical protein|nr:hypothetical protein [Puia sp.]